jgi:hypothetical protein
MSVICDICYSVGHVLYVNPLVCSLFIISTEEDGMEPSPPPVSGIRVGTKDFTYIQLDRPRYATSGLRSCIEYGYTVYEYAGRESTPFSVSTGSREGVGGRGRFSEGGRRQVNEMFSMLDTVISLLEPFVRPLGRTPPV